MVQNVIKRRLWNRPDDWRRSIEFSRSSSLREGSKTFQNGKEFSNMFRECFINIMFQNFIETSRRGPKMFHNIIESSRIFSNAR